MAGDLAEGLSKAGLDVWLDTRDLLPGDNWPKEIGKALEEAEAMVVLVSPALGQCHWMRKEIEYALGSEKFAGRIIPVVVQPTPAMPWVLGKMKSLQANDDPDKLSRDIVALLQAA